MGSGFIVDPDGYVLTNFHVTEKADSIRVTLLDGRDYEARVVAKDPDVDLAVLRIEETGLPSVELGDSSKVRVGQWVLAIGSPFGLDWTVTQGIVSAMRPGPGGPSGGNFIQTDAAINPGNSGGPLVDLDGRVIGVNTSILSRRGGFQGISLAVPIRSAKRLLREVILGSAPKPVRLGALLQDIPRLAAERLGVKKSVVGVRTVMRGSPAYRAGLKEGDVILKANRRQVQSVQDIRNLIQDASPGDEVRLLVRRRREELSIPIKLSERPEYSLSPKGERGRERRVGLATVEEAVQTPVTGKELSALLTSRYCGCPCGRRLMDCFGCSVAKADLALARNGLRDQSSLWQIHNKLSAPLVLVEWGDMTSRETQRVGRIVARLRREYGSLLKVVFRHLPPKPDHAGRRVAVAMECAREQGRFWEFHDLLMETGDLRDDKTLVSLAGEAGCKPDLFQTCFANKTFAAQLNKDVQASGDFEVTSTPMFFLNDRRLETPRTYEDFKEALERVLVEGSL